MEQTNINGYETPANAMSGADHIYSALTIGRNSESTVRSESSSSEYTYVDTDNMSHKQHIHKSCDTKRTLFILITFILGLAIGTGITSTAFLLHSRSKSILEENYETHTGNLSFSTSDKYQFRMIRCELGRLPFKQEFVSFAVKACSDVFVVLTSTKNDSDPLVEVALGVNGNTRSGIRTVKLGGNRVTTKGEFINCRIYNNFWISWRSGKIVVGLGLHEGENVIMKFVDKRRLNIRNIGISTGFGNTGEWMFIDTKV